MAALVLVTNGRRARFCPTRFWAATRISVRPREIGRVALKFPIPLLWCAISGATLGLGSGGLSHRAGRRARHTRDLSHNPAEALFSPAFVTPGSAIRRRLRSTVVMTPLGDRGSPADANLRAVQVLQLLNRWNWPCAR